MKHLLLILTILIIHTAKSFSQTDSTKIIAGAKVTLTSNILDYDPEIFIGLPANYNDTASYPVIIILDAEWLFEGFAGLTKVMGQLEEIPECIIVGFPLEKSFKHYGEEYAPKITKFPGSGHADKMLQFISAELFPLIDSLYNGSEDKIIWGHSVPGGLFCTYVLLGDDTQFSGIISSSPNLQMMQEYIVKENAFDALSKKGSVFYYLSFGTDEDKHFMEGMFKQVQEFGDKLKNEAPTNLTWVYRLNEHNNHFTNAVESYIDGLKLYFEKMK